MRIINHIVMHYSDTPPVKGDKVTVMCGKTITYHGDKERKFACGRCATELLKEMNRRVNKVTKFRMELRGIDRDYLEDE